MQVGRWNHQSSHSGSSHSGGSHRPYSPRSQPGRGGPSRFPSRGGYGNRGRSPARRGGFGVFGETEAEISKFMNKTVVTTEEPVFIPEHKFSDFNINEHLKKNIIAKNTNFQRRFKTRLFRTRSSAKISSVSPRPVPGKQRHFSSRLLIR